MTNEDDIKVKNLFRRIGDVNDLKLRVFDSAHDDNRLWSEGGLTFQYNGMVYGSNDGGWYFDEPWIVNGKELAEHTPVVIVEGTFGPETGNTGSAQYARFSHCVGAALNGVLAIYFIPHNAVYRGQTVQWRYQLVYGCIGASKILPGNILMIDAYKLDDLKEIIKIFSKRNENERVEIINYHLEKLIKYAKSKFNPKSEEELRNKILNDKRNFYLFLDEEKVGKICMYNVIGFSDINFRTGQKFKRASYRNAHIRVGESLLHNYWLKKDFYIIYLRWDHNDVKEIDKLNSKEWKIIRERDDINIITLDDLEFQENKLERELRKFMDVLPMKGDNAKRKNALVKQVQKSFNEGRVKINWDSVVQLNKSKHLKIMKKSTQKTLF